MSLSVEVGSLAYYLENKHINSAASLRDDFQKMNAVLCELQLTPHNEPEVLPPLVSRARIQSFSYATIHYLRRAYAYFLDAPDDPIEYLDPEEPPEEDILLDLEVDQMRSHLISHSDSEGMYIPVDFESIVVDPGDEDRIPGGLLGSSQQLQRELIEIAPALGIRLVESLLTDEEAERLNEQIASSSKFQNEKMAWLVLFEASRLSVEYKTAIRFC